MTYFPVAFDDEVRLNCCLIQLAFHLPGSSVVAQSTFAEQLHAFLCRHYNRTLTDDEVKFWLNSAAPVLHNASLRHSKTARLLYAFIWRLANHQSTSHKNREAALKLLVEALEVGWSIYRRTVTIPDPLNRLPAACHSLTFSGGVDTATTGVTLLLRLHALRFEAATECLQRHEEALCAALEEGILLRTVRAVCSRCQIYE